MFRIRTALCSGDEDLVEQLLDATVRETLRVRPISFATARRIRQPVELGGYQVPNNAVVMAAGALVQRSPDWFENPDEFHPERFLTDKIDLHAWIPFGGGPRRCLGASLAMTEMVTVLRTILEHVEFETTDRPDEPVQPRNVVRAPKHGAVVVIRRKLAKQDRPADGASRPPSPDCPHA
jgi:cytochrome P450